MEKNGLVKNNEYFAEEYFHVYNRGVEKREIFVDVADYLRFCEILREFNTTRNVSIEKRRRESAKNRIGSTLLAGKVEPILYQHEEKLVEILAWCLMSNHYHLLLRPLVEGGVAKFMTKINTGFTMYFNKRYERSGHLFQGRYKHKEIDTESSLLYVSAYIHLNPVRANICQSAEQYPWSSCKDFVSDYQGRVNVDKDFVGVSADEYKIFINGLTEKYEKIVAFEEMLIDFD